MMVNLCICMKYYLFYASYTQQVRVTPDFSWAFTNPQAKGKAGM